MFPAQGFLDNAIGEPYEQEFGGLDGSLKANGGNPGDSILARFGGSVKRGGVTIAMVPALHSNGLDPDYIGGELGKT